jgi:hypothetical protein
MRSAVVLDDVGMVNRHDLRVTIEVIDGIATVVHDARHQGVGKRERRGGLIDELVLKLPPAA